MRNLLKNTNKIETNNWQMITSSVAFVILTVGLYKMPETKKILIGPETQMKHGMVKGLVVLDH